MGSWSHTQIWISKVTEIWDVCWSTIITYSHVFVILSSLALDGISVVCYVVNLRCDILCCEMVKLGMQIACSVNIIRYWWWEYEFEFERFGYGKSQIAGAVCWSASELSDAVTWDMCTFQEGLIKSQTDRLCVSWLRKESSQLLLHLLMRYCKYQNNCGWCICCSCLGVAGQTWLKNICPLCCLSEQSMM